MKKIIMTLTYSRACSRSTKRTSSFGTRLIAAFAAVLCCAMTVAMMTACTNNIDNPSDPIHGDDSRIVGKVAAVSWSNQIR